MWLLRNKRFGVSLLKWWQTPASDDYHSILHIERTGNNTILFSASRPRYVLFSLFVPTNTSVNIEPNPPWTKNIQLCIMCLPDFDWLNSGGGGAWLRPVHQARWWTTVLNTAKKHGNTSLKGNSLYVLPNFVLFDKISSDQK